MKSKERFIYKKGSLQYDLDLDEDTDICQVKSKDSDKMRDEDKNEELEVTERNEDAKEKRRSVHETHSVNKSLTKCVLRICTNADLKLNVTE